jgi:hypothetical protein
LAWSTATGVIFDGTILGGVAELLIALPIYLVLRKFGWLSRPKIVALGVLAAIGASQFVAFTQRSSPFQQSALTQFAVSWLSPALACLSGGAAGLCVAYLTSRRTKLREPLSFFGFLLPIVSLMICVLTLTSSSQVWRRGDDGCPYVGLMSKTLRKSAKITGSVERSLK